MEGKRDVYGTYLDRIWNVYGPYILHVLGERGCSRTLDLH